MIKIYDINDNVLIQAELTSAAVREEELSKSDYIQLSFSTAEKLILPVGAYIEHTYKIDKVREVTQKFLLLEAYEPTQTSECSWKYTPKFQHPKMILSKTPFYILTRNSKNEQVKQSVWSFVGITSSLCEKIADFLNKDIKFGKCGWVCNMVDITANTVNVSFSDNDFISALSAICNAIGDNCEWHIDYDNERIYIGKVVVGSEPVLLEVGKNIGSPSVNSSKESYYNSFSVFGGSRNITQTNEKGENIPLGDIRLQLSAGSGSILIDGKQQAFTIDEFSTIDLRKDKEKEPLFTKILDFSDIFPSLNTYAYNVRGRVKYVLDENNKKIPLTNNSDGSVKEYKTFTVWYMRLAYPTTEKVSGKTLINTTIDNGITHYWYDFEITDDLLINGKNIGCSFEVNFNEDALSTPLAGRGTNGDYVGFELTYHDKDELSKTSDDVSGEGFRIKNGDYEIIYQEDNNVIIPSNAESMLIPRGEEKPSLNCNITILYNIAMKESIYENDAKNRLLDAAKKEIIRLLSDLNNYSFKSYPQIFAADNPCLQIGQNVTYNDGNGYTLESRVLKLTTNIDYDFVQEITIGNQTIKGTTTQLREDVQKIISSGGVNEGSTYTAAQMNNIIAKHGINHFLSKKFNDTAQGFIEFLKGLKSDELVQLLKGATFGNNGYVFDKNGNIVINSAQSLDFDDALQKGFGLAKNSLGKYELSLTNLFVWGKAVFNELEIRKLSSAGGNVVLSAAASKIVHVEEYSDSSTGVIGYKCYLLADDGTTATTNGWKKYDQARCQQFNIKEGTYHNVSNRDYWRAVVDVSTEAETIYGSREVVGEDGTVTTEKYDLYDGKKFDWIILSVTNCRDRDNDDAPMTGDTIVLDGHQQFADDSPNAIYNDADRTNLIMLETTGAVGVPRIVALTNIVDFNHDENNEVFVLSPTKVIFVTKFFEFRSASGDSVTLINNKGDWQEGTKYYYYDQVVYENAYWTCIAKGEKEPTTEKPSLESGVWRKDLEIGEAVKVENTEILYAIGDGSTAPTQPSDDKFVYNDINEALADIEIGDYLWSKTIVTYTDGHETVTYGVSRLGEDGEKGDKGDNGANAITIQFLGAPLIFDANSDGIVPGGFSKSAFLIVKEGGVDMSRYVDDLNFDKSNSVNIDTDKVYKDFPWDESCWEVGINSDGISKITLSDSKTEVSATSGYVGITFKYKDRWYDTQLPFQVNVARYTGELTLTNRQFKVSMDGLTTRMGTAEGNITDVNTRLTTKVASLHSEISSTAESVKAEVTKQMNGNLKKAGLEIKADGITLYGDKITITNDDGKTATALFSNGKINASLIDVKHLWAISEDGTSKVGYFGNDTDSACIIDDNTTAPLFVGGSTAIMSNFYVTSNGKMVAKDAEISGTLKGVNGTFEELTDITGKMSIGFQNNGFFIRGYTRFYDDVSINGKLVSQGANANYLACGVWARGTFGSYARLTLMCIDNHRYYYEDNNTKRVQGQTLGYSTNILDGHYPFLVSMMPVPSTDLDLNDGEESCEFYGASFDLVIIRTTSRDGYYKFTNCFYGKVFHVINGYGSQRVYVAYQGGWFALEGGMGITMAYLGPSMYTPTSTKAGAGFFILGSYDNNW